MNIEVYKKKWGTFVICKALCDKPEKTDIIEYPKKSRHILSNMTTIIKKLHVFIVFPIAKFIHK